MISNRTLANTQGQAQYPIQYDSQQIHGNQMNNNEDEVYSHGDDVHSHDDEKWYPLDENESSIFVSIPSYRDSECAKTVKDLFFKARHPERIVVGLCEQNYAMDDPCVDAITRSSRSNQIRTYKMPAVDAKGPAYARAIIENELFDAQESELFLQIDSHTRFTKHWDIQCIRELTFCPHEKCILTMYPESYQRTTSSWNFQKVAKPKFISFHSWHKRTGFPLQDSKPFKSLPSRVYPSAYFAGNFAFGRSDAWADVPTDIDIPYLFLGEEQSMAPRFYTHGWDLMSPMTMLVYTLDDRSYRKTFWEQLYKKFEVVDAKTCDERKQIEERSVQRIQSLLQNGTLPNPADNVLFGLGNVRTLQQYEELAGYDFKRQIATPRARLGISLESSNEEWLEKIGGRKKDWKNIFTASLQKNNLPLEGPGDLTRAETYQPGRNLYPTQQKAQFVGWKHRQGNVPKPSNGKRSTVPYVQSRFS